MRAGIGRACWQRWWPVLVVVMVGVVAMMPTLLYGISQGNDLRHHYRVAFSLYDALRAGDWYPGRFDGPNGGYGDFTLRLYPPLTYYLLAAARALAGDWYDASVWLFVALSVAGGLGAYYYARQLAAREIAMWAGAFYALAPYRLNQIHESFLLAEYAGGAILPFVFACVERVCRNRRWRDVAGLAATYALLILTHLPLTVIGSLSLLIYVVFRLGIKGARRVWLQLACGVALALAASAFFWVTMVTEMTWIKISHINTGSYFDYRQYFLFLKFTVDRFWVYVLASMTALMSLPAFGLLIRARHQEKGEAGSEPQQATKSVVIMLLVSLFMLTPLSQPVWRSVPMLANIQFPWRWLAVSSLAGAVSVSLSMQRWQRVRGHARKLAILAFSGPVLALAFMGLHFMTPGYYNTRAMFNDEISSIPGSPSLPEWKTIWSHNRLRPMSAPLEVEGRSVDVVAWGPQRCAFNLGPGFAAEARVRTLFYPHWVAFAGDRKLETRPDADGALLITLSNETRSVSLEFREPARTRIATLISICALVLIGALWSPAKLERSRAITSQKHGWLVGPMR
jgi:hypothetical protein